MNQTSLLNLTNQFTNQFSESYHGLHSLSHSYLGTYHPQSVFEHGWKTMNSTLTPKQIIVWVSFTLQVVFYLALSTPSFIFPFFRSLDRWRIQPTKWVPIREQLHALRVVFTTKILMILPTAYFGYELFHYIHYDVPLDYSSMPHWYVLLYRLIASLAIEDTWHYFMHRALHHPRIYGYVHKIHHTYSAPFAIAAEYAHPIETFILSIGFFLPLVLFFDHIIFFWTWLFLRMAETADVHSGYDIPFITLINPLHLLPFYGGPRFHDYHHKAFNVNYASTFTFWDWVFGTDEQYVKHENTRKQQKIQAKEKKAN